MSESVSPNSNENRHAQGYAVLGRCWQLPDEELVAALEGGELTAVLPGVGPVDRSDLRVEYTRLFVGPEAPPCPPYESVYRDGSSDQPGKVLGPSTGAVVKWYQTFDLGLDPEHSDLPDHVATELEFVAHLLGNGRTEKAEQFLDEHPRQWLAPFLRQVREETREPFYAELAEVTEEVIFSPEA